jgi:hypothetical protein
MLCLVVVVAMSWGKTTRPAWKPPGKMKQVAVLIALLPLYIPVLLLLSTWTLVTRKSIEF